MISYYMKKSTIAIAINGRSGVGKDTMIGVASEHFNIRNISSVDPIKQLARIGGWRDEDKATEKGRQLLVDIKKLFVDFNDFPTKFLTNEFQECKKARMDFMFAHIREPEEIEKFIGATGAKTLLVTRKDVEKHFDIANDNNVSAFKYDYTFQNDKSIAESGKEFVELLREIRG